MPLPRYQPSKRLKITGPSISDLDDATLSKILGYVLEFSSFSDQCDSSTVCDNVRAERNLSMVSKRWYFLTQALVADHGVHRVNLNSLTKQQPLRAKTNNTSVQQMRGTSRILAHKNQMVNRTNATLDDKIRSVDDFYNIDMLRRLQPRLYKYKHFLFEGALPTYEFKKLIVALDASRAEQLSFDVFIEKRYSLIKDRISLPVKLKHLEKLTLNWTLDKRGTYSNELTWRVYKRATNLRTLELHAKTTSSACLDEIPFDPSDPDHITMSTNHHKLHRVVFTWSPSEPGIDCPVLPLMKNILQSESSVTEVETNDPTFIEYLIKSTDRACTTHRLKNLKLSWPIRDINLLAKLFRSKTLGTNRLSVETDEIELINEVRLAMEYFRHSRPPSALCRIVFSFKDQKFPDYEEKIKTMVHLSRMTDLLFKIEAQQRISIDCCHLMWSVGRALQAKQQPTDTPGRCLFKITIIGINPNKLTEVTVPFGQCRNYSVNSAREDLHRHREIMKSLKKDCYHQFVKSVRGNLTP